MSKNFIFRFSMCLVAVAASVMWLLTVIPATQEAMSWFSLGWAIMIISGFCGLMFVLRGLFGKSAGPVKKFYVYFGCGLIAVALFAMVGELAMPKQIVMPIIAIVVSVALMLGFLSVGGKKWDSGDNQKAGYKNYYERKAEEEKKDGEEK